MSSYGTSWVIKWKQTTIGVELDFSMDNELVSNEGSDHKEAVSEIDINELCLIWKPYIRYTRKGWMFRSSTSYRSKFKEISIEDLLDAMKKIKNIPSYLVPITMNEVEKMQTILLDVSL
jgi:hypothetical protein